MALKEKDAKTTKFKEISVGSDSWVVFSMIE